MMPFRHLLYVGALLVICHHQPSELFSHAANIVGSPANGPRIEIKPAVPIVLFEAHTPSSKVLTCKALGDKPGMFNQLRWSGPDRMDNWNELSKKHRVRENTQNGYSVELDLQKPSPDDSGIYYCQGTYQSSDFYNASIQVKVYNPIKLENCPERQFVVENSTGQKINCHVTGDGPALVLYKDNNPIDSKRYKWDNEDGIQIMGPVNKDDAGVYSVEVTTEVTGDRRIQYVVVEVHSKPGIIPYTPSNGSIAEAFGTEGERAELKCEVTGNPKPLVNWFDPRLRNLTSVGGYHVNPVEGTLIIDKVNRVDDNGNFVCIAYNHVGEARRNVSMIVLQRPNIVAFENRTVQEESEPFFECRATGNPKPTFSIRRMGMNQLPISVGDNQLGDTSEAEEGGGSQVFIYRVKLKPVNRSHFGLYYCNATNIAGTSERIGQLTVRHMPDLTQTPVEQYVRVGKNVTVVCHIKAFPQPIVTWYNDLDQQILNAQVNSKISTDGQTHIVTMMPPQNLQGSSTRYKCQAENELGKTRQSIMIRFTTHPGVVNAMIQEKTPTTVKLHLTVSNDGGDRVRAYKYRIEGHPRDTSAPISYYPKYSQNDTIIDSLTTSSTYTIRNLLPRYTYQISIRAINEIGEGDTTVISADTTEPSRPEPPIIIKPNIVAPTQIGFPSDYQNGYVLKWSPPDLDNGDPITKYLIKINKVNPDSPDILLDDFEQLIEQTNERPLHARIGPLDTNQHYMIQLQARNKYGDSEPAKILISTNADRPMLPDFGPQALTWFTEPSTPVLVGLLILAIISLIITDIMFCLCFQIGVSHMIRNCCCPAKANSVISDKTYT